MSQVQRTALIVVAVAVLVGGFVVARGGGHTTTSAASAVVRVQGGKPAGGIAHLVFAKGGQVRFTVASDVADEIHVHGYNLMRDVTAGGTVSFAFTGTIDGIFEVELEHAGVQIAELKVTP